MAREKQKPQFMIVYKCTACGMESGFTELDKPMCRFCDATDGLEMVSKQELTPEVMAARLKAVTDNMMNNLESAFQALPDVDKNALGEDVDPEEEMLKLLARVQKFRDQIQGLKLTKPGEGSE
jgi:hypothetical protein